MTISNDSNSYNECYVWAWLEGETSPVVAGKLTTSGKQIFFNYGKKYLEQENAIALYEPELPLKSGIIPPLSGLWIASAIRDAAPDAWGRRVIISKLLDKNNKSESNEIFYLLNSGSNRIGALDFQASPSIYEPRFTSHATLEELMESAGRVEKGLPINDELDNALFHGSSIGGARPKAMIDAEDKKYIAKFSASSDIYSVVKAEFIAMKLAKLVGINVAEVRLTQASGKDVLLIERFDRTQLAGGFGRKNIVSALTMLELDEMMARYASYAKLAEIIRYRFTNPKAALQELFARIVFNILCGNTDDHARNHAAFWNGKELELTPAYDICPQNRTGGEATQAMLISGNNRMSKISSCLNAANIFLLTTPEAQNIVDKQVEIINKKWNDICEDAEISSVEKDFFWKRQFLNDFAFE